MIQTPGSMQLVQIMQMNWRTLSFLLALVLLSSCIQQPEDYCTGVLDGDTFELRTGEIVRLIGIDAPDYSEPGGTMARDYLSSLVLNKKVALKADQRDDYGRLLRYVYVDDICVNEEMIKNGYAETRYLSENDPARGYYIQLEMEAERKRAGLWNHGIFQPRLTLNWEGNIPIIDWRDAHEYYGEYVIVKGVIADTYTTGKVCFLNFHSDSEQYFTAVIFACDFPSFPDGPEAYTGKKVQIIGFIREYNGKPELIVKIPEQIRIIE
ncbi:MAG: thermonuclease family protein [Theionarchaea archaeon]|nr:MAG: hypothetical protein AYK18_12890 [Theionarchaea archaeon DG-70]MBU7010356.1 thermonuclease family protein [Theionarchaea archaeon]